MTLDRNSHQPIDNDIVAAKAFAAQFNKKNLSRLVSVIPFIKDFKDALDKSSEMFQDYNVDYTLTLIKTMYHQGKLNSKDNIDDLTQRLHNDEALSLFVGHCKEIADRSNSRMAKILLAIYTAKVITSPKLIEDPVSGVMIDVLSSVNDFDLFHFEDMSDFLNMKEDMLKEQSIKQAFEITANKRKIQSPPRKKMFFDFRTSIRKFINMGVFDLTLGNAVYDSNPIVKMNNYSDILYELCKEYHELYEKTEKPSEWGFFLYSA